MIWTMRLPFLLVLALTALVGCATTPPQLTNRDYVVIDTSRPAYTVYVGIPADRYEAVRSRLELAQTSSVQMISWEAFSADPDRFVSARIQRNDYPDQKAVPGILELVRRFPGTPIGLTWNGGIAITRNDYHYAEQTYRRYQDDPKVAVRAGPSQDPVNPKAHLGPLLGW